MHVREATPADAPAIEALVAGDLDADRLVRDRRVIVAERDETTDEDGDGNIEGVLSYDTFGDTVHVSTLVGDSELVKALLVEPRRFAEREELPIEIVVPESDEVLREAVENGGFEVVGDGPSFEGGPSKRYRYPTDDTEADD